MSDFHFTSNRRTFQTNIRDKNAITWNDKKDKLQQRFPTLTDSDLRYEKGKRDEMLARVQTKINKSREELNRIISEL